MSSESTRALVERAQAGDRAAFDRLVESHRDDIRRALSSSVDRPLREVLGLDELSQLTIVGAYTAIGRFQWRGEGSFGAWLRQIARNVVLEALRRARRHASLEIVREPSHGGPTPSRAARREERFDRLRTAFEGLAPDHRRVVRLSRLEGLTLVEVSERMGRSPDAVRKLLGRALAELRRSFGDTESLHLPDRPLGEHGDA